MPTTDWRSDSATHPRQLLECERSTPTGRPSGDRDWFRTEPQLGPQDGKCLCANVLGVPFGTWIGNALGGLISGAIRTDKLITLISHEMMLAYDRLLCATSGRRDEARVIRGRYSDRYEGSPTPTSRQRCAP
jgi:hypothetical protein